MTELSPQPPNSHDRIPPPLAVPIIPIRRLFLNLSPWPFPLPNLSTRLANQKIISSGRILGDGAISLVKGYGWWRWCDGKGRGEMTTIFGLGGDGGERSQKDGKDAGEKISTWC